MTEEEKEKIAAKMREEAEKEGFGPTGERTPSKLGEVDQGNLKLGIARIEDTVFINFGVPVVWLGLKAEHAESLGRSLIEHAKEAREFVEKKNIQ